MATTAKRPGRPRAGLLNLLLIGVAMAQSVGTSSAPASALGVGAVTRARSRASEPTARALLPAPSPAAMRFLDAYARADEVGADALASPLYRAAWDRRGPSAEERAAIRGVAARQGGVPLRERLRFTYFGGAPDARGFGHLLFVARSALTAGPAMPSVFRVDVSPDGQVIWLEMVWLFAEGAGPLHTVTGSDLGRIPLPPVPCCARALFGVASDDSHEAYYAYALYADGPGQAPAGEPASIGFFAVDSDRQLRPGAWSFGQDDGSVLPYGERRREPRAWSLLPDESTLLGTYLDTIGGQAPARSGGVP